MVKRTITETDGCLLDDYMGQKVTIYCCRYIYTGKLVSYDETFLKLVDTSIVYETGDYSDTEWKDVQKLVNQISQCDFWLVDRGAIESMGILK